MRSKKFFFRRKVVPVVDENTSTGVVKVTNGEGNKASLLNTPRNFLSDETNPQAIKVRQKLIEVLENIEELSQETSVLASKRIISRIRVSLKIMNKDVMEIKKQFEAIGASLASGDFFSWDNFMKELVDKLHHSGYVKQKDRETLREVAIILSSETTLSVPDLDAHIRWLVYSIDPALNIKEELSSMLFEKKQNFIWQKEKLEGEFNAYEKLLKHINPTKLKSMTKTVNSLIRKVTSLSKGKKDLNQADIEKLHDIFEDTVISF